MVVSLLLRLLYILILISFSLPSNLAVRKAPSPLPFTLFVQPICILPFQYQLSLRRGLCALKTEATLSPKRELHIQENDNFNTGRRENFRCHYEARLPRHSTWLRIICVNSTTAVRLPQKNSCVRMRIQKQVLHAHFIKTFCTTLLMRGFRVSAHQAVWPYHNVSLNTTDKTTQNHLSLLITQLCNNTPNS
jgi:hypothetical protein